MRSSTCDRTSSSRSSPCRCGSSPRCRRSNKRLISRRDRRGPRARSTRDGPGIGAGSPAGRRARDPAPRPAPAGPRRHGPPLPGRASRPRVAAVDPPHLGGRRPARLRVRVPLGRGLRAGRLQPRDAGPHRHAPAPEARHRGGHRPLRAPADPRGRHPRAAGAPRARAAVPHRRRAARRPGARAGGLRHGRRVRRRHARPRGLMREELRTYFERELSYLRQLGGEFATKYPKIASRLALDADGSQDPHVERLIEAVAFLTARLRHKLDDDLPEVSDALLGILYPHYLAPIPSMTVAQFHIDPTQAQLGGSYEIPRHTVITTRPVRGIRCRFRTAYPVTLWPLEVTDAVLESPITAKPLGGARDFRARSSIRLRLRTLGGIPFAELRPPRLRLFLHGEGALAAGLYEILCAGPCQVELHPPRRIAEREPLLLPPDAIRPVGFEADDALMPCPSHSFRGYGLLEEYFAFPEKFLFVDL